MSTKDVFKRKLKGVVVSNKGDKTVIVRVERKVKHPMYSKFVVKAKKYHAHDEQNRAQMGETVSIIESRPHSKLKKWELV